MEIHNLHLELDVQQTHILYIRGPQTLGHGPLLGHGLLGTGLCKWLAGMRAHGTQLAQAAGWQAFMRMCTSHTSQAV